MFTYWDVADGTCDVTAAVVCVVVACAAVVPEELIEKPVDACVEFPPNEKPVDGWVVFPPNEKLDDAWVVLPKENPVDGWVVVPPKENPVDDWVVVPREKLAVVWVVPPKEKPVVAWVVLPNKEKPVDAWVVPPKENAADTVGVAPNEKPAGAWVAGAWEVGNVDRLKLVGAGVLTVAAVLCCTLVVGGLGINPKLGVVPREKEGGFEVFKLNAGFVVAAAELIVEGATPNVGTLVGNEKAGAKTNLKNINIW